MGQKVSGFFLMVIILVGCSGCLSDPDRTQSSFPLPQSTHVPSPVYYAARLVSGGGVQDTIPALDNPVFN